MVAIIGILAAIAIPNFMRFQLKSKTSEAKVNLSAIRVVEQSYNSEHGTYFAAAPEPFPIPGVHKAAFDMAGSDFAQLGWEPDGDVYFSYGVAITSDGHGFTADAAADLDGDTNPQLWGYSKANPAGGQVNGQSGCAFAALPGETVAPCTLDSGQSLF